jgi:hypothetical protein
MDVQEQVAQVVEEQEITVEPLTQGQVLTEQVVAEEQELLVQTEVLLVEQVEQV